MNITQIRAALQRGKLQLLSGNKNLPAKNRSLHNRMANYAKSLKPNISYQTLPSSEQLGRNAKTKPRREIIGQKPIGIPIAEAPAMLPTKVTAAIEQDREALEIIRNSGVLEIPDQANLPNDYEFEIIRLRRRGAELECIVRDRDERNVKAIAMLEDCMQFWRSLLYDHIQPTHGAVQLRIAKIEATLAVLKEKGSRIFPPLNVSETSHKTGLSKNSG